MDGRPRPVTRRSYLALAGGLALVGCLGDDGADFVVEHLGDPTADAAVAMVGAGGDRYEPALVHVEAGATVTWSLDSGVHDVVAYHPANDRPRRVPAGTDPWASDLLTDAGSTFAHRFEATGVYDYLCTPHEHVGMVGRVVVGWPALDAEPALAGTGELPRQAARVFDELDATVRDGFA